MRKEKMDVKAMQDRGQRADGAADPVDQPSDIYYNQRGFVSIRRQTAKIFSHRLVLGKFHSPLNCSSHAS